MNKTFLEKTNTVYRAWDPYEECYGYGCDRTTEAFKRSVEKLKKYIENKTIFIGSKTGLKCRLEKHDYVKYEEHIVVFEFKRADTGFIMRSSRDLEDIAEYIWINVDFGSCSHIIK